SAAYRINLRSFPTRRSSDLRILDSAAELGKGLALPGDGNWTGPLNCGDPSATPPSLELCLIKPRTPPGIMELLPPDQIAFQRMRSEEHTSELQSRENLVCRL